MDEWGEGEVGFEGGGRVESDGGGGFGSEGEGGEVDLVMVVVVVGGDRGVEGGGSSFDFDFGLDFAWVEEGGSGFDFDFDFVSDFDFG